MRDASLVCTSTSVEPHAAALVSFLCTWNNPPRFAAVALTDPQVALAVGNALRKRRLVPGDSVADWTDSTGTVGLVERNLPAAWAGKKLNELGTPGQYTLAAITRLGAAQVARPELIGQDGDILHFMADLSNLEALEYQLQHGPTH